MGLERAGWRTVSFSEVDPYACATEEQVRAGFAPYGRWAGPAAAHALRVGRLRSAARPIEAAAA